MAAFVASGLLLGRHACAQTPDDARAAAIREVVQRNLHYSVHCFCQAYTDETLAAARKNATVADVRALILLLKDPPGPVTFAAHDLLIDYADESLPLLKAAHLSRDDKLSAAALYVIVGIEAKRGADTGKLIEELSQSRERTVDEALARPSPNVITLIERSVEKTSPECRRRLDYGSFWLDWQCGASSLRIGVTEFSSAEAASRRMMRAARGRARIEPLEGVGQEASVAEWRESSATGWHGGSFLALRRDTFVMTLETTIMAAGMGADEPPLVQTRVRAIAKDLDAGLVRAPLDPSQSR
jgi:hypothetical protein